MFDSGGTTVRIQKAREHTAAQHTLLGWQVDDVTRAVGDLTARGARFERYPWMPPSDLPIWDAPGGAARVAWFKDPDGNVLSITQVIAGGMA